MKTNNFAEYCRRMRRVAGRQGRLILCLLGLLFSGTLTARAGDALLTMTFENVSGKPEYHWIGESFAVTMSDLIDVPGLMVVSLNERNLAYERLGIPTRDILTRAAVIRLAEAAQANLALVGDYDIGGDPGAITIAIRARLIETREGRLVGNKSFNFSGPLAELQVMQGQLAWNILYERDPALPYSRDKMVTRAKSIPPRAFESFVKGFLTGDQKLRESFLRRALQEYDSESGAGHYAQALYELGTLLYSQRNFAEAAKLLGQLTSDDPHYVEGQYFFGLAAYNSGNVSGAASAYEKLAALLPMAEVYNNAGALLTAKGDLPAALPVLKRGVEANSNDVMLRFNYGYALWKAKNFEQAVPQLKAVVAANNRDGEALYLLAKSLAAAGNKTEADQVDQDAKRYLGNYARWEVAPDKMPSLVRLKTDFNYAAFYRLGRQQQRSPEVPRGQAASMQQAMERARQFFAARQDAEALNELQQVLASDPTFAEAHLLRGRLYQRRNEVENAVNALKAAVYWNPRLTGAHVALGQIYLARGDRASALTHGKRAIELDPQDREAVALMRQIESDR
ncbi:MAG TPA: tetratricopeptide repeat protein [Blastocatellia bacterium]|nr:tetratricopeptide repeat protein [Blastocatellia bacterium]